MKTRRLSRGALWVFGLIAAVGVLSAASCRRSATGSGREVVLYCSMDGQVVRPLLDAFTKQTGVRVLLVGDTEATKTTGLVQRLIAERDRPRADVFWSSEPLGLMRLAREGILEEHRSPQAEARVAGGGGWPADMRARDGTWYALAPRARVVVANTTHAPNPSLTNLWSLTEERWKGRIGMARPQFGTTRAHMAALLAYCGEEQYRAWLTALRDNGMRLYDGNGAVVRAAASGEIWLGLTDNDDVNSGVRNGWKVAQHLPHSHIQMWHYVMDHPREFPYLAMRIPGAVGVVKGGPNAAEAAALVEYILSERVEAALAAGEWGSMRVAGDEGPLTKGSAPVDLSRVAEQEARALVIFEEVFAGK